MNSVLPIGIELRDGELYADGWTTQRLVLAVEGRRRGPAVLKVQGWNPMCSAKYCVNRIALKTEEDADVKDVLLGETFELAVPLNGDTAAICTLTSEAVMPPDALDERERGVVLLSVACEAAADAAAAPQPESDRASRARPARRPSRAAGNASA